MGVDEAVRAYDAGGGSPVAAGDGVKEMRCVVVGRRDFAGGVAGRDDGAGVVMVCDGGDERRSGSAGRWTGFWAIVFWLLMFGAAFVGRWN